MDALRLPLRARSQQFAIDLGGRRYVMTTRFNVPVGTWTFDLFDEAQRPVLLSVPMITGADLFGQHQYLNIGRAVVVTDGDPDALPTFENLGAEANVYYVT